MVAFRKCLPVLAVLALLLGVSVQANAQAFSCNANAGVPTIARAEGIADLVGDVILNCTGGTAGTTFTANFQVFLNTNITSRIVSGSTTEALLLVGEPAAAAAVSGTNVFAGTLVTANSVAWLGVPITQPGPTGTTLVIRFTNVRANANQAGLSSTLIPNSIVMFISASGTQSIPINNPQQVVAYVQKGLNVDLRNCANSSSASAQSVQQCVGTNTTLAGDSTASGAIAFAARFTEGFATAFKPVGVTAAGVETSNPANVSQLGPGTVYNTESGLTLGLQASTGLNAATGVATNGTRLLLRFNNIPSGLQAFVSVSQISTSTATATAVLVSTSDATGAGGAAISPIASTGTQTCSASGSTGIAPVTLTAGAGSATWEVTGASSTAIESLLFAVVFAGKPNTASNLPALGTGTVTGSFAPLSTVTTASSSAPVPRFADVPTTLNAVTVSACVTNLLFPYVTSAANFDTGIAISNTTVDPFGTAAQAGACTLNYYGTVTGGGAAPAAATTGTIAAGSQLIFTLFSGNTAQGVAATPNFTGYMIAQCKFQFAHGFAFVSDLGSRNLAMGYLALIVPAPGGTRAPTDAPQGGSEALNQ